MPQFTVSNEELEEAYNRTYQSRKYETQPYLTPDQKEVVKYFLTKVLGYGAETDRNGNISLFEYLPFS